MWRVLAIATTLAGCGRLFDLEPPVLDLGHGDSGVPDDAMGDGGVDGSGNDAPPDSSNVGCPASYTTVLGVSTTRYRVVTNMAISWDNAQSQCLADQIMNAPRYTHLVVATSDLELAALQAPVSTEIWVGLSDRAIEGSFQWVTQETNNYPPSTGAPWAAGEPKQSGAEDCVYMNTNGNLVVRSCGLGKNFVCECDAVMNDPTRY